jgi:tetratricopeptide (TPR) repeat protein
MPHFAAAQDEELEINIRNQTSDQMAVFAVWDSGTRTRLGDLNAGQRRTFTVPVRGQEVTLAIQMPQVRGRGGRVGGDDPDQFVTVRAGDQIEWDIRSTSPFELDWRRVGSSSLDNIESQEPRVSRYTALSAMRIGEAEGEEDPVAQEALYLATLQSINEGLLEEDNNPEAYLHLAMVQTALGNYAAADSAFDYAEALYPAYADEEFGTGAYRLNAWIEAYNEAVTLMDADDAEGALEFFHLANLVFDERPEAYLNIGVQTANTGDLEGSISAWRSAIAIIESPDIEPPEEETRESWDAELWPLALTNLGQILSAAGLPEEAVPVYEALLERDPDNADARSGLALALATSGQSDDALSVFDEILASSAGGALDYFNAGVSLYTADQLEQAAVGFEKALEVAPMYRDALQNLAQTYNILEDYEAQVPHSERLLELDPYNEYGHQIHVRALSQLGQQTELVAAIEVLQGLPFVTDYLTLQPRNSGAIVSGQAINKTLEPGTTITLRFTFYDDDGNPVGTQDTEITLSDVEVALQFQLEFDGGMQVLGYGYEFLN